MEYAGRNSQGGLAHVVNAVYAGKVTPVLFDYLSLFFKRLSQSLSAWKEAQRKLRYGVWSDAEMNVEGRSWCGSTESRHPDEGPAFPEPAVPAKSGGGFNRDAGSDAKNVALISVRLRFEQLPAGHRYHGCAHAVLHGEKFRGHHRDMHLGTGGQHGDIARARGFQQHVGAASGKIFVSVSGADDGQILS
jgi:hypothetical protein